MGWIIRGGAVAVAVVTTALTAGPIAHGDPDGSDAGFLESLQATGISYSGADHAVAAARTVCRLAENGRSGPDVVAILKARNPDLTSERAAQFIAIAERSYCPEQLARSNPPDGAGGTE